MAVVQSVTWIILFICISRAYSNTVIATCDVKPNAETPVEVQEPVVGTVTLTQTDGGSTSISIELSGFNTSDANTKHGFHIHASGDIISGCSNAGGHFNPYNVSHGAQTGDISNRHVGDLGNILEDENGDVSKTIVDSIVSLTGENAVADLGIVVHEKEDDLGTGGDEGSRTTGNAGSRLACCKITLSTGAGTAWTSSITTLFSALGLVLAVLIEH